MKSHKIDLILESAYGMPWAITEGKLNDILSVLDRRNQGLIPKAELEAFQQNLDTDPENDYRLTPGGVAVVSVSGIIAQRMNMIMRFSGGTSTEQLGATIQKAIRDSEVKALVLDVNSPGGAVGGVAEVSDLIFSLRNEKPIVAVANTLMASAAYWIGSAAGELVASPSATVGSIGIYMIHSERSKLDENIGVKRTIIGAGKYKTVGNDAEPLSDESKDRLQRFVNAAYSLFAESVARNRKTTPQNVADGYGQGDVVLGENAVKAALVDRVATLQEVIDELEARFKATPAAGPSALSTGSAIMADTEEFVTTVADAIKNRQQSQQRLLDLQTEIEATGFVSADGLCSHYNLTYADLLTLVNAKIIPRPLDGESTIGWPAITFQGFESALRVAIGADADAESETLDR